jgi:tRNA A-37 threonylcarbamoyl transferase component Bud32
VRAQRTRGPSSLRTGREVADRFEKLNERTLPAYLELRGLVTNRADVRVATLSGGISNVVLRGDWPEGSVVVKQPLPRLMVKAEWEFAQSRIFVERDCIEVLADLLPGVAPTVVFVDEPRFVLAISTLPRGGIVWKDAHMAGRLDARRTRAAAQLLGRLQRATVGDARLAARFDNLMPLTEGRIDPYHRAAAAANPDLADRIETEVERLLASRSVLVHGDFSPKNLIAYHKKMMMLDFEVAHWGDPAFDPAFLISHLILGSCHHEKLAGAFIDEAVRFWQTYRASAGAAGADEPSVVTELACLLLARIDGKSPIEYLTAENKRHAVRRYARTILLDDNLREVEAALTLARGLLRGEPEV